MLLVFLLLVASALADTHIYVRLYDNGDIVGTGQIGTLSWRSNVIFDLSHGEIILQGENVNVSRSWNSIAGRENIAIGSAPDLYLPVRDGTAAEYARMREREADAIIGLALSSPITWHWQCIELTPSRITLKSDPCREWDYVRCNGSCTIDGVRLFAPGSTFYATSDIIETAHQTWGDIQIGPFRISRATYQKTDVEKAIQFLSVGTPALSSLSLRSYRFKLHVDKGAISWDRVVVDTTLPPPARALSLILLVAWAVYYVEHSKEATHASAWIMATLALVGGIQTLSLYSNVIFFGQGILVILFTVHAMTGFLAAIAIVAEERVPFASLWIQAAAWSAICLYSLHETDGAWAETRFAIPIIGFLLVFARAAMEVIELVPFGTEYDEFAVWALQTGTAVILSVVHVIVSSLYCLAPAMEYYQALDSDALFVILALAIFATALLVYAHRK